MPLSSVTFGELGPRSAILETWWLAFYETRGLNFARPAGPRGLLRLVGGGEMRVAAVLLLGVLGEVTGLSLPGRGFQYRTRHPPQACSQSTSRRQALEFLALQSLALTSGARSALADIDYGRATRPAGSEDAKLSALQIKQALKSLKDMQAN